MTRRRRQSWLDMLPLLVACRVTAGSQSAADDPPADVAAPRRRFAPPTLLSMVYQTYQPDKIFVWLPRVVERLGNSTAVTQVPEELKGLQKRFPSLIQVSC